MTAQEFLSKAALMQEEIVKLDQELQTKKALYKAFTKEHIGLADGEPINVLDIFRAIKKAASFD